ncbi:signal peptidase I [Streptococcus urinalis FB127-CNA-2]|uniref:Signal peptidase I n=1 Tax=Streptococcus urinalis 2285-97 TaxID=764291 RepID=G5KGI3_9STRE|nr:signal peptidase I [Streptococcus urinalis]EHJ55880.1 signal peptidase I [Streptococcus urinalis 2285-97]EKS22351.1 signal peptidase I [Streptococcus urinalis FB127-CNA-2]VEF32164.1 Signal peptidase I [Streptococcus urinalis]
MVKRDFIRNILLVLLAIVIFILLRIFVFSTYRVTNEASSSFLHEKDVVTIKKSVEPKRKDFIVYKVNNKKYLSRVIAKEGDTVTFMDDIFYLNNKIEEQPYIDKLKSDYISSAPMGSLFTNDFTVSTITKGKYDKIPKDYYLVLNDNRQNKQDSREFGFIKKDQIKGVVTFRLLPLKQFGFVKVE